MSAYHPWDQEEKLGPPPWDADDPKLQAWEAAHGHDVRLKCYPEFGCLCLESELEALQAEVRRLLVMSVHAPRRGEEMGWWSLGVAGEPEAKDFPLIAALLQEEVG